MLYGAMAEVEGEWVTKSFTFLNSKVRGLRKEAGKWVGAHVIEDLESYAKKFGHYHKQRVSLGVVIMGDHKPNCILDRAFSLSKIQKGKMWSIAIRARFQQSRDNAQGPVIEKKG